MGGKPLDLAQWLLVDQERDTDLAEIGQLIDAHRDEIIYCEPSAYEGCDELSIEVLQHLRLLMYMNFLPCRNLTIKTNYSAESIF